MASATIRTGRFVAIGASAAAVGVLCYLFATGFCFTSFSHADDREYIRRALHYNAGDMGLADTREAFDAFLAGNPGCCAVDRRSHMAGMRHVVVQLNYRKPMGAHHRDVEPFYQQYVEITACGKRGHRYGQGTRTLERAVPVP